MLSRKILAINLTPLALFLAGVLYLDNHRDDLIEAKVRSLTVHGRLVAEALGATLVEAGVDEGGRPIVGISRDSATQLIERLVGDSDVRARLFRMPEPGKDDVRRLDDGALIVDSRGLVQLEALPPPGIETWLQRWLRRIDHMLLGLPPALADYEDYVEHATQVTGHYGEALQALRGKTSHALRDAGSDGLVLTVAVPVSASRYQEVQGALMLSSDLSDVEDGLRAGRRDLLGLALIAFVTTVLLSLYLSGTIVRPVRRLAAAAEHVRSRYGRAANIPDLSARGDEIGELSRALIDMTDSLEQRMKANKQFAEYIAHQIKNPLSSLRAAIEFLPHAPDDEARNDSLRIAADGIARIDRLITDIADASSLDAELARETHEIVDMGLLLHALASVLRATWGGNGPILATVPDGAAEEVAGRFVVSGIEDRLDQALRNVLDNARSFSPPGSVITLSCRADGPWIEIAVEDQGSGIPAGMDEAIFERFRSERGEGRKSAQHSGLGLSIARQIIEGHGGEIRAATVTDRSGQPQGARFTVRLPAAAGASRPAPDRTGSDAETGGGGAVAA